MHEAPPDLRVLRPEPPAPLAEVIVKALAKDPADRWPSAPDMLAGLGAPVTAG